MFSWSLFPFVSPSSPEGQQFIREQMARGAYGPLYDAATMAEAKAKRERAEAAFAEAERTHPLSGVVH